MSTVIGRCTRYQRIRDLMSWCATQRERPRWQDICTRFECSRATAYRYLQLWDDMELDRLREICGTQPTRPTQN